MFRVSRILELAHCGIGITRRPCESHAAGHDIITADLQRAPLRPGERIEVETYRDGVWVVLTQLRVPALTLG
jgi:hypothetical protein